MNVLYIGRYKPKEKENVVYIDNPTANKLAAQSLIDCKIVIDLDCCRIQKPKLKKLLNKADNVVCVTAKEFKAKNIDSLFDKVVHSKDTEDEFDLFLCIKAILLGKERLKVFELLQQHKPPLRLLMRWLNSNIDENDKENFLWLAKIDLYMEKVKDKIIYRMLSLIKPSVMYDRRLRYIKYSGERE